MTTLYHCEFFRSTKVLFTVLETPGLADKVTVKTLTGATFKQELEPVNKLARIPTLVDDGQVVIEAEAIVRVLLRKVPAEAAAQVQPTCERGWRVFDQVLAFSVDAEACVQDAFAEVHFKGEAADMAKVKAAKERWDGKVAPQYEQWLDEMAAKGKGEFIACDHFTVADAFAFYVLNWAAMMKWLEGKPKLEKYVAAIAKRDAVAKMFPSQATH